MSYANQITLRRSVVLADFLPGDRLRDLLQVVGGTSVTGLTAQLTIHLPGTQVPIT